MPDIKFSACRDDEVAWEIGTSGEFTERAMRLFAAGIDGLSNRAFADRVVDAFGPGARQHPMLDCADANAGLRLLQPRSAHDARGGMSSAVAATRAADCSDAWHTVHLLSQALSDLSRR